METFDNLNKALNRALAELGLGADLPGPDQMLTNALGITLAHRWGRRAGAPPRSLHTYAPEHKNERTSHFERVPEADKLEMAGKQNNQWHKYSFLVDFYVERWAGPPESRTEMPVVGAEIEAYPRHGVSDDIDDNDYQWDFYKLLHVQVPRRFFMACACKEGLDKLETSLKNARKRTRELARKDDRLALILLPAGTGEWDEVRLGVAKGGADLQFARGRYTGA